MGYWKSKVFPKIKKVFHKNGTKKADGAAEASKSFDDSKDEYNKAIEEKKTELQPKVLEIYEASSAEIKSLVKDRNEAGLKNSTAVHKFLEELVRIEFPGSKPASEACSKYGASSVPGPVFFVFEKVSTFIIVTEKQEKAEVPETTTSTAADRNIEIVTEEEIKQDKEIVIEEEIKQEETEKTDTEAAKLEDPPAESAKDKEEEKSAEPVVASAAADEYAKTDPAGPPKP